MAPPGAEALHAPAGTTAAVTIGGVRPDTVEAVLRNDDAHRIAAELGIGSRKLARLARQYLASAHTDWRFGTWLLAYADPTGETAVRNVLRERGVSI